MKNACMVLMLFASMQVFGQGHFIGLQGGASWANVNTDVFTKGNGSRIGFIGGLSYEYQINENYQLGLDLVYAQKGFSNDIVFTDETGEPIGEGMSKFYYDYLSFPIKGGYSMGNTIIGFFNLGLVPSVLIQAKTTTPGFQNMEGETFDVTDKVTAFDFGGLAELGGKYQLNEKMVLFLSLAYQMSFTSFTNSGYFPNSDAKHYGMTMFAGLKYGLNK